MSNKSNNQGRAYEFACLKSLENAISKIRSVDIPRNSSFQAAESAWGTLDDQEKKLYLLSADSIIPTIFAMEPNIVEKGESPLILYIQTDDRGKEADVRDIIIHRDDIIWEIGLSIKHNHEAVKHSRLSRQRDFGEAWYGVKCSDSYWKEVGPIFSLLETMQKQGLYFREITSKEDDIYLPILQSFIKEIERAEKSDKSISSRLVAYLLSKYDFYKVISIDLKQITTIQSFNMYGTLNRASRTKKPDITTPTIKLPTELIHIGLKTNSKTTVLMCFDNGWQFSFRIHNAKDKIEPSLKFDIQIIGMPIEVNIKYNCPWNKSISK
ncbi:HaeIII family restriction endonuclease [Porphyromonas endodontalis]|uniref:HaeIII family restriction endonuclease n=1 Tax=Porphyromonas endodontalis TaxID=28124 RepID=UPI0028ED4D34|nr:HaeIII family restriction endonuclease [Porphyromonas endodontalis]